MARVNEESNSFTSYCDGICHQNQRQKNMNMNMSKMVYYGWEYHVRM